MIKSVDPQKRSGPHKRRHAVRGRRLCAAYQVPSFFFGGGGGEAARRWALLDVVIDSGPVICSPVTMSFSNELSIPLNARG